MGSSLGGGSTQSARYCYAVWMRHILHAWQNGMTTLPLNIIELGPGRSLGVGITALISGAEQYYGLDSIKFCNVEDNLKIFDDLVVLIRQRTPIPNEEEFPTIKPKLDDYNFPEHIFTSEHLERVLADNRLLKIRNSIKALEFPPSIKSKGIISYLAPWQDVSLIEPGSIDLILSQSVLQYMDDLTKTYNLMSSWLKPQGWISHQIDLKSLGSADTWDGHWSYSDMEWKIVKGRKNYNINRGSYATHINLLKNNNFKITKIIKGTSVAVIQRNKLARRFKSLTDEDRTTSNLFIQAIKAD